MALSRQQVKWLWREYIGKGYNNRIKMISYITAILIGARPNWIWKVSNKNKGIRIKHMKYLYTRTNTYLWKTYGLRLPLIHWRKVEAIRFEIWNPKGKGKGHKLVRHIGRTKIEQMDPVLEIVSMVSNMARINQLKGEEYLFSKYNGKPLTYNEMARWVLEWRGKLQGLTTEQKNRVRLHTIRKTFANLAFRAGLDMLKIATYGTWALPTAITIYVNYDMQYAIGLAYKLLYGRIIKARKEISINMNKVYNFNK